MIQQAQNRMMQAAEQSREAIGHYPFTTALVTFGVGLGLGVLFGSMIADAAFAEKKQAQWGDQFLEAMRRYTPENLRFSK